MPGLRPFLWLSRLLAVSLLACCSSFSVRAHAFVHIVQKGETLAAIAERFYGRIQFEKILVAANALDAEGGIGIAPGMRLEVPAVSYYTVGAGDSWELLAERLLGSKDRSDVLSLSNDSKPWLTPEEGSKIKIPYNLRVIASERDNIVTLAYKFLGDRQRAWVLDRYNGLSGKALARGDVVLIPLTDLPLTPQGEAAATKASESVCREARGRERQVELAIAKEIPAMIADNRAARYVNAVTRGVRFLSQGHPPRPQKAVIYRQLLEAYSALGATGLAIDACAGWLEAEENATLDPNFLSPKLLEACRQVPKSKAPKSE